MLKHQYENMQYLHNFYKRRDLSENSEWEPTLQAFAQIVTSNT